jgi:hypothetical protein
MNDYFAVGMAIEAVLRDNMGDKLDGVYSPFTVNDPAVLKQKAVTAHVNLLPSEFGNDSGNGARQAETQRWQVLLCFKTPTTREQEQILREKAGAVVLQMRSLLQGANLGVVGAKPLKAVANHTYLSEDCRFWIFATTYSVVCVI